MNIWVGTSGYNYPEWKGSFYPEKMKSAEMLPYYAERFPTVEINNTFYRMPREHVLHDWSSKVPGSFRFAIKASQRITHYGRLTDVDDSVSYFTRVTSELGERRGPTLFQLPPNLKKDVPRLLAFLELLPKRWMAAFEFRHSSWFDSDTYDALRARECAMVIADHDDFLTPAVATATWGYARLHKTTYTAAELAEWSAKLTGLGFHSLYVYFKHDEAEGSGPDGALAFAGLIQ
jgi:uncharacterized protein YecE (DUF72 family)